MWRLRLGRSCLSQNLKADAHFPLSILDRLVTPLRLLAFTLALTILTACVSTADRPSAPAQRNTALEADGQRNVDLLVSTCFDYIKTGNPEPDILAAAGFAPSQSPGEFWSFTRPQTASGSPQTGIRYRMGGGQCGLSVRSGLSTQVYSAALAAALTRRGLTQADAQLGSDIALWVTAGERLSYRVRIAQGENRSTSMSITRQN